MFELDERGEQYCEERHFMESAVLFKDPVKNLEAAVELLTFVCRALSWCNMWVVDAVVSAEYPSLACDAVSRLK